MILQLINWVQLSMWQYSSLAAPDAMGLQWQWNKVSKVTTTDANAMKLYTVVVYEFSK